MSEKRIRCVIVDDEEMATRVIASHLSHVPGFEIVGVFHGSVEAFLALETLEADVLFLDIQMPKVTGLSMLKMLKKPPLTVLTTAHREYALEGFELEVVDYLLKPVGLDRFLQTIGRLKRMLKTNGGAGPADTPVGNPVEESQNAPASATHLFAKADGAYHKIELAGILHVEAVKNHIKIVTRKGNHISLMALSAFEEKLPDGFLRVHRSFIVNVGNILRFGPFSVTHEAGEVPIGRSYKEEVVDRLKKLLADN
jgi:DNA-binding LytR/AlgR family response regulator